MSESVLDSKKSLSIEERINKLQKRNLLIDDYGLLYDYKKILILIITLLDIDFYWIIMMLKRIIITITKVLS